MVLARRHEDEPLDASRQQPLDDLPLAACGSVDPACRQHVAAVFSRPFLDGPLCLGQERIRYIVEDKPDGEGAAVPAPEMTGYQVWLVVQRSTAART